MTKRQRLRLQDAREVKNRLQNDAEVIGCRMGVVWVLYETIAFSSPLLAMLRLLTYKFKDSLAFLRIAVATLRLA